MCLTILEHYELKGYTKENLKEYLVLSLVIWKRIHFDATKSSYSQGRYWIAVLKISENSTKLSKFSKQLLCRAPLGICFSNYTEFMENICSVVAPIETGEALAHPLVFEKSNKNCKVLIYFTLVLTFTYSLNFPSYCIHDLWQRWRKTISLFSPIMEIATRIWLNYFWFFHAVINIVYIDNNKLVVILLKRWRLYVTVIKTRLARLNSANLEVSIESLMSRNNYRYVMP